MFSQLYLVVYILYMHVYNVALYVYAVMYILLYSVCSFSMAFKCVICVKYIVYVLCQMY